MSPPIGQIVISFIWICRKKVLYLYINTNHLIDNSIQRPTTMLITSFKLLITTSPKIWISR